MNLNATQIKILEVLSSGKTAKQTMLDLNLSKSEYYKLFNNCKIQLNAKNKIETLLKAITLQIIDKNSCKQK